jgi:hypothetical protein
MHQRLTTGLVLLAAAFLLVAVLVFAAVQN